MSEWISVEDRLPKTDTDFLVFDNYGVVSIANHWELVNKWLSGDARVVPQAKVTHWMPLPEPPKETNNDQEHN